MINSEIRIICLLFRNDEFNGASEKLYANLVPEKDKLEA